MDRIAGNMAIYFEFEQRSRSVKRVAASHGFLPRIDTEILPGVDVSPRTAHQPRAEQAADGVLTARRHKRQVNIQQMMPDGKRTAAGRRPFQTINRAKSRIDSQTL